MAKLILPGISSSDLSTLVVDKKGLVYDLDNNQIVYGDGTATGGLLLGGMSALNISAGTTSSNATNFVFSNANSVTFGMTGKTITASFSAGGGLTNVNLSAGTTSNNLSKFQFNDSNGVSFGLNGSTITATVKTDYLTTAMQSNAATISNINISAGTTSNLLSAITFGDANSISFGLNNGTVTALYQHNHTNNIYATGNTTQSSSMTNDNRSITFRGEGIASVGASNNSIIISATQSNQAVSAAGGSSAFQTLVFNNANGFSFSNNGGSIEGSYTVPTVTNSSFSVQDSATTINPVNRIAFSTGNNITLSLSTGAGSATVGVQHNLAGTSTGFTGGASISGSMTHNSSGLAVSLSHPAWITTARASTDAIGLNTAKTNVTWTVNSSGLSIDAGGYAGTGTSATNASITLNSNGLAISVAAPGAGGAVNFSAGTTSNNLQSVIFANANNITFGLGTGASSQSITASFNPINIGMSTNGNTAGTTGTFDGANLQYVLAGGNGVTLSQSSNGSSVTLSVHAGNYMSEFMPFNQLGAVTNASNIFGNSSVYFVPFELCNSYYVDRVNFFHSLAYTSSANSTITGTISYMYGIYSRPTNTNSSRIDLIKSSEAYIGFSLAATSCSLIIPDGRNSDTITYFTKNSADAASGQTTMLRDLMAGPRAIQIPLMSTLTPGHYWLGFGMKSQHGTGTASWNIRASLHYQSFTGMGYMPYGSTYTSLASNNATARPFQAGWGSFSAQTAALPATVALNGTNIKNMTNYITPLFNLSGWTTNASNI